MSHRWDGNRARRLCQAGEVVVRVVAVMAIPSMLPKVFSGDPTHYIQVAREIHPLRHPAFQWLPYRKVFWEYPPVTVPILFLGRVMSHRFHLFRLLVGLIMAGFELECLRLLRKAWPEYWWRLTAIWSLTLAPVALLSWFRLDFVATLFATVGLIAIARRRSGGGASLALGFATKLWPIVLTGPLLIGRRWRDATIAIAGSVASVVVWYAWSPSGVTRFIEFRSSTGLEVESLLGGFDLFGHHGPIRLISGTWTLADAGGHWAQPLLYVALVLVGGYCFLRARAAGADMVAFGGALTLALMLFSWILSPQYLVWVAPFVAVLAARGHRRVAWWYGSATLVTFLALMNFEQWYAVPHAVTTSPVAVAVIVIRNLLLVGLLVELTVAIRPSSHAIDTDRATGAEQASTDDVAGLQATEPQAAPA